MEAGTRTSRPEVDPLTGMSNTGPKEVCDWTHLRECISAERDLLLPIAAERAYESGSVTLSSGRASNYYIDGKNVSLWPRGALLLARAILKAIRHQPVDAIGGLTIGADPIVGAVVALSALEGQPIPGFIVRKEPKKHGKMAFIEGQIQVGWRAVIVDDVITTGASIMKTIKTVEEHGVRVVGVLALTDREEGGMASLEASGYPTFAIFTAQELAKERDVVDVRRSKGSTRRGLAS